MSDLTVRELKRDAARVKHEVDELDRVAHGMTFDELLRLLEVFHILLRQLWGQGS